MLHKYAQPRLSLMLAFAGSIMACSVKPAKTAVAIDHGTTDYSKEEYWAALPSRLDSADFTPDQSMRDGQAEAKVDVFFLHPTTMTGKKGHTDWNADLNNAALNLRTDKSTILHQASVFNAAARVYAPRYRQAHLHAYYTKAHQRSQAINAFAIAYQDVRAAFSYYLEKYNEGRPFIIAAHSQGTQHAVSLIKECIDTTEMRDKMVAAYLVGMPVRKDGFQNIGLCQTPQQTGCFCSWRTFRRGYQPSDRQNADAIAVTNPLTFDVQQAVAGKEMNKGTVLFRFHDDLHPGLASAEVRSGVLWSVKPKFPWSFLMTNRNYHVADYNLYYANVRQNVVDRIETYLSQN